VLETRTMETAVVEDIPTWYDEDEVTMTAPEGTGDIAAQVIANESTEAVSGAQAIFDSQYEAEKEKNRKRAERFQLDYVEPSKTKVFGVKRAAVQQGFATGFDLTTDEEQKKRAARAARFAGMVDPGPAENPDLLAERAEAFEEEEKRKARAAKFGVEFTEMDEGLEDGLLEEAKEASNMAEQRMNAVHVYGVDKMSTGNIMSCFSGYGPSWVEWINDSSCNVVFEDDPSAARVLFTLALPEKDGSKLRLDRSVLREIVPYAAKGGEKISLRIRGCSTDDVRPDRPNPNSAWARSIHNPRRRGSKDKQHQKRGSSAPPSSGRKRSREESEIEAMPEPMAKEGSAGAVGLTTKKRRQAAPEDQVSAKMFAADLRSILGNRKAKAPAQDMAEDGGAADEAALPVAEEAAPQAEGGTVEMALEPEVEV